MEKFIVLFEIMLFLSLFSTLSLAKGEPLPYDPEAQEIAIEGNGTTTTTKPEPFRIKMPKIDPLAVWILGFIVFIVGIVLIIGYKKKTSRSSQDFMLK